MVVIGTSRAGGAGKTSLSVNLAALWGQGQRTLLIDLDEQGDASSWLGIQDTGEALADALTGRAGLDMAIRPTECGVDVAPAGEAISFVADRVQPDSVRRALATVKHRGYRTVVIDCAPSLRPIVIAAWLAAPEVHAVVPVDSPKALRAVGRLRHAWEDAGLDAASMKIALIRHDGRRVLDRAVDEQARELYGPAVLETRVRESVVMSESAAWHRPLVLHAPTHPLTNDLRRLAQEVAHG